ncbi:variant surface glycoprotein (VSG)-related [Trypanosoma brucei gambiense DAL972]|uniref:Variant surface glycoprotein (VSG)-related n=3 Tax=Trypanosoma brucei TaxID=5691 RepID=C9ZN93_TRYB9|nr:variant surface glycoprotein (VSG)-related [Trypanosoma brucei gambiense DAL972]AGH60583.1 variant surface glycoprotein 1666 [Trypanosoma brucei]APD73672.1 variant surface glycoprotein 1125.1476 [Trypanosoma brucei]RHW72414.1 variant surface protein [Trypanosoma brucei equiperdum]CBH10871.1 variant surface glycoprotein (VSG)-related [Trypanosoma brucei gambiense DAL972]|eukprot:XP_011773158.1 variant surface glycoprotein (VSG)-related [Trypanosoma brucei gambiense DAL972]
MKVWKTVRFIVGAVLVMADASNAEGSLANEREFATLCGFVSLTHQIRESVYKVREKSEVDVILLQKKVADILFGTGISDVGSMKWQQYRQQDCGQDSGGRTFPGGETLVKDLICLCDGTDLQPRRDALCYAENTEQSRYTGWKNTLNHEKTWSRLQGKCEADHREGTPTRAEFENKKEQLRSGIKGRKDKEGTYYTYGGNAKNGLQICNGIATTEADGICVLYKRGSDGDNTSGIEWLNKLEELVKIVEGMDQSTNSDAKTVVETETKEKPKENPPSGRRDESTQGGSRYTPTATSTEANVSPARPAGEQKSYSQVISIPLRVLFSLIL